MSGDRYAQIYRQQAARYDQLVACEDHGGRLLETIAALVPLDDAEVVELGAGTGRLTRMLAGRVRRVRAFDREEAMLAVARQRLAADGVDNCELAVAEHRSLPVAERSAELVIEGWSLGHLLAEGGLRAARAALDEMLRVVAPGGTAIVIETLGTGRRHPRAPSPELAELYALMTDELEFESTWIRTDYRFESPEQAARLTGFFFGEGLAERILRERLVHVPECTGLWWARR